MVYGLGFRVEFRAFRTIQIEGVGGSKVPVTPASPIHLPGSVCPWGDELNEKVGDRSARAGRGLGGLRQQGGVRGAGGVCLRVPWVKQWEG